MNYVDACLISKPGHSYAGWWHIQFYKSTVRLNFAATGLFPEYRSVADILKPKNEADVNLRDKGVWQHRLTANALSNKCLISVVFNNQYLELGVWSTCKSITELNIPCL